MSVSDEGSDEEDSDEESPVSVTVKHVEQEQEDYLNNDLSLGNLFEVMASHLAEEHPEDPLDSLISFLTGIKEGGDLESV